MGMDNNFFKIKKSELKGNEGIIPEFIYSFGNLKKYELTSFRNNYILDEIVRDLFNAKFCDSIECRKITKEQLKEIISTLYTKYGEYDYDDEEEYYDWEKVNEAVEKLEIVYKLFNFEEDYLIYDYI